MRKELSEYLYYVERSIDTALLLAENSCCQVCHEIYLILLEIQNEHLKMMEKVNDSVVGQPRSRERLR